ncbi:MAG: lytic transglycosylase [Bacteroidetes bacterium QS_9_68_14]|nr:MAG: lytic transglycosylase [Bacteroidetes bacterium QS_9_68_14]
MLLIRSKSFRAGAGAALVLLLAAALVAALPPSYRAQVGLQSVSRASGASEAPPTGDDGARFAPARTYLHDRAALNLALPSGASTFEAPEAAPLAEGERLQKMSRLYRYQASLMEARAAGDEAQVGRVLDRAMGEMQALARRPGLWKDARFQRLYGHLAEAYRRHYGAPDTLSVTRGGIFATRDSLFAAVERARTEAAAFGLSDAPLLAQAGTETLAPQNTEVGMPVNDLTRAALRYLQREPEGHVYRWMRRKETYFPMIEHIFAEEGVPDELKYLALVESGLNPQAESWADAAGIWQFVPETGRAYGLEITPWVDERLDPEKATRAAAAHLKDLHRMFDGDWHLALSGYNCSPTRIREALAQVRREGKRPTFWNIYPYIPRETRNYVPTYVAAALMLSNPGHFDLKPVQPGPRYRFDRVPVSGMLPLETAAELAGTTTQKLRALNPSLRKDVLPPSAEPFMLRLPYGTHESFSENYAALPDSAKGLTLAHRVREGETPGGIAERYDVALSALEKANALSDASITAGDSLVIPTTGARPATARADARPHPQQPRRVQYSARTLRPLAADGTLPGAQQEAGGHAGDGATTGDDVTTYHVKRGDTLYGIARRHDVSVMDLRRWNDGLDGGGGGLQPGRTLTVHSS